MTQSFGPTLMAVSWLLAAFGTTFLVLRIYTAFFVTKLKKADFWAAMVTYIFAFTSQIVLTVAVAKWGLGHHAVDLTHQESINSQLFQWIFGTTSIIATALGKIAVILFILQFENQTKHVRKYFLYFLGFGTIAINIVILCLIWTQCTPTAKMWNFALPGNCNRRPTEQKVSYFQGSFGTFADLSLAIYPIAVFWTLSMPRNVKVGLSFLFSFGLVAAITSTVKTVELHLFLTAADPTFSRTQLNLWASIEMWVVFIVCCLPQVRVLFVKGISKVFSSAKGTQGRSGYVLDDMPRSQGNFSKAFSQTGRATRPINNNDSEEDVLVGKNKEIIIMTTDVDVQYGDLERGARRG